MGECGREPAEFIVEPGKAILKFPTALVAIFAGFAMRACAFRRAVPMTVGWRRSRCSIPPGEEWRTRTTEKGLYVSYAYHRT